MFGSSLLARAGITAAAVAVAFVGGCHYRASKVPAEILEEGQRLLTLERDCAEGSVCASGLEARAASQEAVVAAAVEAAALRAADAAALQLKQEQDARAAAERQALEAGRRARAASARLEAALQSSQECRVWAEQPVPCPLE